MLHCRPHITKPKHWAILCNCQCKYQNDAQMAVVAGASHVGECQRTTLQGHFCSYIKVQVLYFVSDIVNAAFSTSHAFTAGPQDQRVTCCYHLMFTMCIKIEFAACNNSGGVYMKYKRWRAKECVTNNEQCMHLCFMIYLQPRDYSLLIFLTTYVVVPLNDN